MSNAIRDNFIEWCKGNNPKRLMEAASFFFFYCLLFLLSFSVENIFGVTTILLTISVWLAYGNPFKVKWYRSYPLVWLVIYFLVHVIWLIGADDFTRGLSIIEKNLPFLAFPFILPIIIEHIDKQKLLFGYKLYILSCFLVSLLALVLALYKNIQLNGLESYQEEYFTSHTVITFLDLHATYFSLNIIIACFLIYTIILQKTESIKLGEKLFYTAATVLFLIMLYFLRARIVLLGGVIVVTLIALFSKEKKLKIITLSSLCAFVLIFVLALIYDSSFKERLLQITRIDMNQLMGTNSENGVTQRIFLWQRYLDAVKEAPLLGYGTGDMYDVNIASIKSYMLKNSLSEISREAINTFLENPWNPHNQFLADTVEFGVCGLIVGLILFGNALVISFRRKHMPLFGFITIFFIACQTEGVLLRQKGICLFCVFYVIFIMDESLKSISN